MKTRTIFRIVNILFWLGIWAGVVWWTEVYWQWISMSAELIIVAVPALFIHIALRTEAPEA